MEARPHDPSLINFEQRELLKVVMFTPPRQRLLIEIRTESLDFRQPMRMKLAIMLTKCLVPVLALKLNTLEDNLSADRMMVK
jgi:hypothetical protein